MFIGRRPDGSIYGTWTVPQRQDADHPGIEEVADSHPEVVAFMNRPQQAIGVKEQRARAIRSLAENDPEAAKVVEVLEAAGLI